VRNLCDLVSEFITETSNFSEHFALCDFYVKNHHTQIVLKHELDDFLSTIFFLCENYVNFFFVKFMFSMIAEIILIIYM